MIGSVAVIVRVSNEERRVERALRSVLGQSHGDWTVVLAVPHSDTTATADKALAALGLQDDARFRVVAGDEGVHRGALANLAVGAVESDYVVLHDDDGSWTEGFLDRTVAFLAAEPDHVGVATRVDVVFEREDGGEVREVRREILAQDDRAASLVSLTWGNFVPPASLVFRRTAFETVGGYDESLSALEDWDFLLRLLALGPLGFLPEQSLAAWYVEDGETDTVSGTEADAGGGAVDGTIEGTVVRESQELAELAVRDLYLRRDLTSSPAGPTGLGVQLALSRQLRLVADRSDRASTELAQVIDRWGHGHQDHVDMVTSELRLEVNRLRGEMLLVRETLDEVQEDVYVVSQQLEHSMETLTSTIEAAVRAAAHRPAPPPPPPPRRSLARRAAGRVRRRLRRAFASPPAVLEAPRPAKNRKG